MIDDREEDKKIDRKKRLNEKEEDASETFCLGTRYYGASLAQWHTEPKNLNLVHQWLKNPQNMIVLQGPPQVGKTYFCVALANYLLRQGKHVKYITARRLFEDVQKSIQNSHNQYETIKRFCMAEFLFFDDVGASSNSEWQKEMILDLIDQRFSSQKPTIVTSNLDWNEMKNILGERTEARLNAPENLKIIISAKGF